MHIKTLLVLLITLVSLLGGGAIAYLWFLAPAGAPSTSTPVVPQQPGQGSNIQTSVDVKAPTTTTGTHPVLKEIDKEKVYTDAFAKLSARALEFSAVSSDKGPLGDIYALYKGELMRYSINHPGVPPVMHIATADINGDSVAEAFVYVDMPGYCGSGGCPLDIFQKKEGKWKLIFSTIAHDMVGVRTTTNLGYTDILLSVQGTVTAFSTRLVTFSWNTETYVEARDSAVWNGTIFITE